MFCYFHNNSTIWEREDMELNTYRLDCFTLRIYSLHNISTPNNISLSNVLISYIHHKSQVSYFFMFCTFYKKKLEVYFTWSLNEKKPYVCDTRLRQPWCEIFTKKIRCYYNRTNLCIMLQIFRTAASIRQLGERGIKRQENVTKVTQKL